jgi:hypothetical protein
MAWQLTQCAWHDKQQLTAFLADNWEPFSVNGPIIWLRRLVAPPDAKVIERPRLKPEAA